MSDDYARADSRLLHEPFARKLEADGGLAAFRWIAGVLAGQSAALRSSNVHLVAYTGCDEALDWLERTVDSPVTETWGSAAALLGVPWPRIAGWLDVGGPRQLMGLDALIAYRAPAPNMAPLAQVAAPVLPQPPTRAVLEETLAQVLRNRGTPRVQRAVDTILHRADEILAPRVRRVAVADLPRLYLYPDAFDGAAPVLERHETVISGMRRMIQKLLGAAEKEGG